MSSNKIQVGDVFTNNQSCDAKVVEYKNSRDLTIEFNDEYKHRKTVEARYLKRGEFNNPFFRSVHGVGMIGDGEYKTSVKIISADGKVRYKRPKVYTIWSSMIARCYSVESHKRRPTYKDVTVCDEWHNYQVFAKWYSSKTYENIDYHLDKDLLSSASKIYSPETCALVPMEVNAAISIHHRSRTDGLVGSFDMPDGRFKASVSLYGTDKNLGYFKTAQEAHKAYVVVKEAYIKEVANKWRGRIDERVYDALMNWTVN